MGASVWWPNKDTQADEPDSQRIEITVPDSLIDVSNGRLQSVGSNTTVATASDGGGTRITSHGPSTWEWFVKNPINNYAIAVAAGHYTHYTEKFNGAKGTLSLDFEVPNTGMERQSAVSYGNWYQNGYRKRDASGTGLGLKWDFIIVHESAHEWFGNNITAKDNADSS